MGELKVRVKKASKLVIRDLTMSSDPYVVMTLGKQMKKTGVKKRSLNPVWDEEHTFTIASVSDHDRYLLTVEVWDEDRFTRDDFMGRAEIDLKPLLQEEEGKKVVAKSNNNFLEKDSNILKHEDGRRAQEVCLKLRGVHSGLLVLNLEYKKPAL